MDKYEIELGLGKLIFWLYIDEESVLCFIT